MGNHLAIEHVTTALRVRMIAAWENARPPVGGPVRVTLGLPPAAQPATPAAINVHLVYARSDPVNANRDLPTRTPDGELMRLPTAVVDLVYLISFPGADGESALRLMGLVLVDLHTQPWLSVADLSAAQTDQPSLAESGLVADGRTIALHPNPLSTDELSRLWAVLPTGSYAPSLVWTATCVPLHRTDVAVLPGRPVSSLDVAADPTGRMPAVTDVRTMGPAILPDGEITVLGRHLDPPTELLLDGEPLSTVGTAGSRRVHLPDPLTPGSHELSARRGAAGRPSAQLTSSSRTVMVAPVLARQPIAETVTADGIRTTTVRVALTAAPRPDRPVQLLLPRHPPDGRPPVQLTCRAIAGSGTEFSATARDLPAGTYLVVVRADGATSPTGGGPEAPDDRPTVVVR